MHCLGVSSPILQYKHIRYLSISIPDGSDYYLYWSVMHHNRYTVKLVSALGLHDCSATVTVGAINACTMM